MADKIGVVKGSLPAATSTVRVFGHTQATDYDYVCDPMELGPKRASFRTRSEPSHVVEVTPRYVGGALDTPTPGLSCTICAFVLDGDYLALASYYRFKGGILIVPQDYIPTWESQQELASFNAAVRRIMDALSN